MRILLMLVAAIASAQSTYDAALAAKLKGDERGMKKYVMAFLKRGPTPPKDPAESARLQDAHMANITRMAHEGKLVLAGPFLDKGELRGIYIFNVETLAEAEALTSTDPAVKAGSLAMELHPWYGSAALLEVVPLHDKIVKKT